ncbi:MAG: DHH family phosphoesterase [Spirochaetota bacterium]|nr:MAG: DHH family phosphoesterase [Spirochaetota bacterium]
MIKTPIETITEKNRIINNIIDVILKREHFLIMGHRSPDDDCIASMVAIALILVKFHKDARIFLKGTVHEHFQYLLNICKYNSISIENNGNRISDTIDTIVVCDTPKPSMVEMDEGTKKLLDDKDVIVVEFDHHIGADSTYIGDKGYSLVTEASSAAELIGHLAFKLRMRTQLLEKYQIPDLFTRNLVLAILTGIIGDSKMGQLLKSSRERRYYRIFSTIFNNLLARETTRETNCANMGEVFNELQRLSKSEELCYNYFINRKKISTSIGWVILTQEDIEKLMTKCNDRESIVTMARAVADTLAEESKKLSLVVYYDNTRESELIQFRMRRSHSYKSFDLRNVLDLFSIKDGGGHEGAIGFRIPKNSIKNLDEYVQKLIDGVEEVISQ